MTCDALVLPGNERVRFVDPDYLVEITDDVMAMLRLNRHTG